MELTRAERTQLGLDFLSEFGGPDSHVERVLFNYLDDTLFLAPVIEFAKTASNLPTSYHGAVVQPQSALNPDLFDPQHPPDRPLVTRFTNQEKLKIQKDFLLEFAPYVFGVCLHETKTKAVLEVTTDSHYPSVDLPESYQDIPLQVEPVWGATATDHFQSFSSEASS